MQIVALKDDIVMGEHVHYRYLKKAENPESPREDELYVCCDAVDKMQDNTFPCTTILQEPKELSLHDMDALPQTATLLIVNGVGTGIGDTLMGSIAIRLLCERFTDCGKYLSIDMLTRENRYQPYMQVFRDSPYIRKIYSAVMPYYDYRRYDYVIQNEGVIAMHGIENKNMVDFWIDRLGMDSQLLEPHRKKPQFYPSRQAVQDIDQWSRLYTPDKPVCVFTPFATDVRGIPDWKQDEFMEFLVAHFSVMVVSSPEHKERMLELDQKYENAMVIFPETLSHTYALIDKMAALVITPDTMLAHLAPCTGTPTICLFTSINPEYRVSYYPNVMAIWPEQWQKSSMVGNHNGIPSKQEYELCWKLFNVEKELTHGMQMWRA